MSPMGDLGILGHAGIFKDLTQVRLYLVSEWKVISGAVVATYAVLKAVPELHKHYREFKEYKALKRWKGADFYTDADLLSATKFYIEPDCQLTDPSGQEDFRGLATVRFPAQRSLQDFLNDLSDRKYWIILADSGMGKTALLINLFARYRNKRRALYLIPLGRPDVDEIITSIPRKQESIVLLDAFDEDTKAIRDYKERLATVMDLCKDFSRIVMTCRTQFFASDSEIPVETGLLKIGIVSAGQPKAHMFSKLYLSPFTDKQVSRYIRMRLPWWKRRLRKKAQALVEVLGDLMFRPMLLAHLFEFVESDKELRHEILIYEALIEAWLIREAPFVNRHLLDEFSIAVAGDIFKNREARGSESISKDEANELAHSISFSLEGWQISERSLLNRTTDGRLKFSHRSLMEFLFAKAFIRSPAVFARLVWTDQIKKFWWNMVRFTYLGNRDPQTKIQELRKNIRNGRIYGDMSSLDHVVENLQL
jgi:hypothetical protein